MVPGQSGFVWCCQYPARCGQGVLCRSSGSAGATCMTGAYLLAEGVPEGGLPWPVRTPPGARLSSPGCAPGRLLTARPPLSSSVVPTVPFMPPPLLGALLPWAGDTSLKPATAPGSTGTLLGSWSCGVLGMLLQRDADGEGASEGTQLSSPSRGMLEAGATVLVWGAPWVTCALPWLGMGLCISQEGSGRSEVAYQNFTGL